MLADIAAPSPGAGLALEQAQYVPRHVLDRHAPFDLAFQVFRKRADDRRTIHGAIQIKQRLLALSQQPGVMVGGPAEHHAVHLFKVRAYRLKAGDAAVDHDFQPWHFLLQAVNPVVFELWNVAVFLGAQPGQPGLACMRDDRGDTRFGHGANEIPKIFIAVVIIHTQAAFHGHGDIHRGPHRAQAFPHQIRFQHQAGAEAAFLHPVGRTTYVEVDLVVPERLAHLGAACQCIRLAATQLKRHRAFLRIEAQQALAIAV